MKIYEKYLKNITQIKDSIFVLNKTDLKIVENKDCMIFISAKNNIGIDLLKEELDRQKRLVEQLRKKNREKEHKW